MNLRISNRNDSHSKSADIIASRAKGKKIMIYSDSKAAV